VLDVSVPEEGLQGPRIVPSVGQRVAAGVSAYGDANVNNVPVSHVFVIKVSSPDREAKKLH
jgi:hypothetical protein